METAQEQPNRKRILAPYLEWLDAAAAAPDRDASSLQIGGSKIPLESFELSVVSRQRLYHWQVLVAEGVALLAKLEDDLVALQKKREGAGQSVETDAAIGFASIRELQRAVDELVVSGEMDNAKKLSAFRTRLLKKVNGLESEIGTDSLRNAEAMAADLVAMQESDRIKREDARKNAKLDEQQQRWKQENVSRLSKLEDQLNRRAKEEAETPPPAPGAEPDAHVSPDTEGAVRRNRAPLLIAVLALLVGAWVVLVAIPSATKIRYPEFTIADFQQPVIEKVVSRAPSLFVTVNAGGWNDLDDIARHKVVLEVAGRIEEGGYVGARFVDDNGRTVAQWMQSNGATVYKRLRPAS